MVDINALIEVRLSSIEPSYHDRLAAACDAIGKSSTSGDPFEVCYAIDVQIGRAEIAELRESLVGLRTDFQERLAASEIQGVTTALAESPETGWERWITIVARSIASFRTGLATRLCSASFAFAGAKESQAQELRRAVRMIAHSRWAEAYGAVSGLTEMEFLPAITRAHLLTITAQIQLYYYGKPGEGRRMLESAQGLVGDECLVLSATGAYHLEQDQRDFAIAETCFRKAIGQSPQRAEGYVGMGDSCDRQDRLEDAEEWYKKAIAAAPGDYGGYSQLMKLYGRPRWFGAREPLIELMIPTIVAVAPESAYQTYLDVGDIYRRNGKYDKASQWYQRAVQLDPGAPRAYLSLSETDRAQERFPDAKRNLQDAITAAPESADGYWGLAELHERLHEWEEALDCYRKALERSPRWRSTLRARIGGVYASMKKFDEAEAELEATLRSDPENAAAREALESLADDYYQQHRDVERAKRVYRLMFDILGDSYKADYHNRLGNLCYYVGDLEAANQEYRVAVQLKPSDSVFRRNLAGTYRELKDYTRAEEELGAALEVDKDEKTYNEQMASVCNAEANDHYEANDYSTAIVNYKRAIGFDAHDDVIHSNLAGAWERLKQRGERLDALSNALSEIERAQAIAPEKNYGADLERLKRKKSFAETYGENSIDWVQVVIPLAVEVGKSLIPLAENPGGGLARDLARYIEEMRERVQQEFGVRIPSIRFRSNEADLPDRMYILLLGEVPVAFGEIALDKRFVAGRPEALAAAGIVGEEAAHPVTGDAGFWVGEQDWSKAGKSNLPLWDSPEYLIRHLEAVIRRNLVDFIGHQEVAEIAESEGLSEELANAPEKLSACVAVCRGLLAENVPLKPFGLIYDLFDELYSQGKSLSEILERVRLLPDLRTKLPGNSNNYNLRRLGDDLEKMIRRCVYQSGSHTVLAMSPADCQNFLGAIRDVIGEGRLALIVENTEARPFVRLLIELEFPDVPVLAQAELLTGLALCDSEPIEWEYDQAPTGSPSAGNGRGNAEREVEGMSQEGRLDSTVVSSEAVQVRGKVAVTVFVNGRFISRNVEEGDQPLESLFAQMQEGLFYELGILLPDVRIELDSSLADHEFRFQLNEQPISVPEGLKPGEFLVDAAPNRLSLLKIDAKEAINPANANECAIVVGRSARDTCQGEGLTTWDAAGFLVLSLSAEIRKNAAAFQTPLATEYMIEVLRPVFPRLIDVALTRFSFQQIRLVLQELLREEISIRDLRAILESLLSINGVTDANFAELIVLDQHVDNLCPVSGLRPLSTLSVAEYADVVRSTLKRYISYKYARGSNTLPVYLVDRNIENRLGPESTPAVTKEVNHRLLEAIRTETRGVSGFPNPVLLTSFGVRKPLRRLLEKDFPRLAVLSYQELSPDMNIQPLARISLT